MLLWGCISEFCDGMIGIIKWVPVQIVESFLQTLFSYGLYISSLKAEINKCAPNIAAAYAQGWSPIRLNCMDNFKFPDIAWFLMLLMHVYYTPQICPQDTDSFPSENDDDASVSQNENIMTDSNGINSVPAVYLQLVHVRKNAIEMVGTRTQQQNCPGAGISIAVPRILSFTWAFSENHGDQDLHHAKTVPL